VPWDQTFDSLPGRNQHGIVEKVAGLSQSEVVLSRSEVTGGSSVVDTSASLSIATGGGDGGDGGGGSTGSDGDIGRKMAGYSFPTGR